jgi:hypothetical protein
LVLVVLVAQVQTLLQMVVLEVQTVMILYFLRLFPRLAVVVELMQMKVLTLLE